MHGPSWGNEDGKLTRWDQAPLREYNLMENLFEFNFELRGFKFASEIKICFKFGSNRGG